MFMINYVTPEKAEGAVKKIYSIFPPEVGVPEPLQLYSASPKYLVKQMAVVSDFMQNDAYDPSLLAAMRYIGASTACFGYCTTFNKQMLESMGLSAEEIEKLGTDPTQAFEGKDAALLTLIAKAIADPDSVSKADIDLAREQGWTDEQVFETTAYAAQMATLGIVFRTFSEK